MTKSGETQCTEWDRSTQTLKFDEPVANVKEMKIIFEEALAADGSRCASCAELSILYGNIQVTPMTASEFVGHIMSAIRMPGIRGFIIPFRMPIRFLVSI